MFKDYLGGETAFYFGFLAFYQTWLLPLLVASCLVAGLQIQFGFNSPKAGLPVYGVAVCLWAMGVIKLWRRKESELYTLWNVQLVEKIQRARPGFVGLRAKHAPEGGLLRRCCFPKPKLLWVTVAGAGT